MPFKNFRVQINAYQYHADFTINCVETSLDIENAISKKRTEYEWIQNQLGLVSNKYNELFHGYANPVNTMNVESKDGKG